MICFVSKLSCDQDYVDQMCDGEARGVVTGRNGTPGLVRLQRVTDNSLREIPLSFISKVRVTTQKTMPT